jgi:mono/diheme cytochrome c family protein
MVPVLSIFGLRLIAGLVAAVLLWVNPDAGLTQESEIVADGKQEFQRYCVTCHGTEGKGDGFMGQYLTIKPADLTQLSKNRNGEFPFWYVYRTIDGREEIRTHGPREMPIWGDEFLRGRGGIPGAPPSPSPADYQLKGRIWALVLYIESIQQK